MPTGPVAWARIGPLAWARRLSWAMLVAAMAAFILLSAPALLVLGIPYDAPEGSFITKIHVGTFLLLLSWSFGLCGQGHPFETLIRQARQHTAVFTYLVCMGLVFVWAAGQHGPAGLAFIIDTLVMPGVAVLAVLLQPRHRQRQLLQMLMCLIVANALLGVAESALRLRLVPIYAAREADFIEEPFFRASALFGHPLANSLVTMSLLPMVALMPWKVYSKLAALVIMALALLAFGSRAALAVLMLYACLALLPLLWRLVRGRYGYVQIVGGTLAMVLGLGALGGVVALSGLGQRIFKNLTWDNSADVRLKSWEVLDHVHGAQAWFGVSMHQIEQIARRIGIDPRYEAIENFWLVLLLLLGGVGFVVFVLGLGCLLVHLWRQAAAPMRVALVVYLVVASGANTLSAKSASLLLLAVAMQCAARPKARHAARSTQPRRAMLHGAARAEFPSTSWSPSIRPAATGHPR